MPRRQTNHKRNRLLLILLIVIISLGIWIVLSLAKFFKPAYQLVFHKGIELKKTQESRINVLLLGIGGGTHDGPLLTDTIIFASIDPEHQRVTLVSIPRDLWMPDLQAKLNTAYAYGEEKRQGGGLQLAKAAVAKITGQTVDYGFRIDFGGFVKAVDMVGGLDVTVDRSFEDAAYPLSGKEIDPCGKTEEEIASLSAEISTGSATESEAFPCRYEDLHFVKGDQHMDGETALKFVRSRHALGPEGTDFARSNRQEKVIKAFKDKVFSIGTLLNPVKVVGLVSTLQDSIDTDISDDEYDDFIKLAEKMRTAKIQSGVVDFGDEQTGRQGLLIEPLRSPEFHNQYVLIPRNGSEDYTEIHAYISCMIKTGTDCLTTPSPSLLPK